MNLETLALSIVIGLVTFRLIMLAQTDKIFERPRNWVHMKLATLGADEDGPGVVGPWLLMLVTCHVCLSIWFAGICTLGVMILSSIRYPFFVWMAAATVHLYLWRRIDPLGEG